MQTSQAAIATEGGPSFLSLPPELRVMIYKELFGKRKEQGFFLDFPDILTDRVMAFSSRLSDGTHPPIKNKNPAILSVNRQLRAEAGKIYYSKQELYLDFEYSDILSEIRSWAENVVGDLAT